MPRNLLLVLALIPVMAAHAQKYQYDASIRLAYLDDHNQSLSQSGEDNLQLRFDILAKELELSEYDEIVVHEHFAVIYKRGYIGFADLSGRPIILPKYTQGRYVYDTQLWMVAEGGKWGLINPIDPSPDRIPLMYSEINNYDGALYGFGSPNCYKVELDGLSGLVDSLGNILAPIEYSYMLQTSNGELLAQKGDKFGIIDSANHVLIPFEFDELKGFYNNRFSPAAVNGKWGLIDKTGKFIVQPEYDDMFTYCGGLLRVRKEGKTGFLDSTGQLIFPLLYENADGCFDYNITRVRHNGKLGIANLQGKLLCEAKYDGIEEFDRPWSKVKIGSLLGVMDTNGVEIVPCIYTEIQFGNYITAKNDTLNDHFLYNGKMISCR